MILFSSLCTKIEKQQKIIQTSLIHPFHRNYFQIISNPFIIISQNPTKWSAKSVNIKTFQPCMQILNFWLPFHCSWSFFDSQSWSRISQLSASHECHICARLSTIKFYEYSWDDLDGNANCIMKQNVEALQQKGILKSFLIVVIFSKKCCRYKMSKIYPFVLW